MERQSFWLKEAIQVQEEFKPSVLSENPPRCSAETLRMLEADAEYPQENTFKEFPGFNGVIQHMGSRYLVKYESAKGGR